jgi:hypothetical protein
MPFDPATRRETWLFQQIGTTAAGKPIYRRLSYNFVEYEGESDRYLEPVSAELDDRPYTDPRIAGEPGAVVGFEFFNARPFETHSINDFSVD